MDASGETADEGSGARGDRKIAAKTNSLAATFNRWIDEGYFDEPRTLAEDAETAPQGGHHGPPNEPSRLLSCSRA